VNHAQGVNGAQPADNFLEAEATIDALPLIVDAADLSRMVTSAGSFGGSLGTAKVRGNLLAQVELACRRLRSAQRGRGEGAKKPSNGQNGEAAESAERGEPAGNGAHPGKADGAEVADNGAHSADADKADAGGNGAHLASEAANGISEDTGFVSTRTLAGEVLGYFLKLGHLPSCASDVR
jgi:hypothetical protein